MKKANILYDKKSDCLYIFLKQGVEDYFEEISPNIFIEYDKKKNPIGIEILNASKLFKKIIPQKSSFVLNEKNKIYQTSKK
jgi:uncharacterized protein YuzE